mgnify:CR=1 FL=1
MSHVKVMMVKHDKREIEQLKHVFEDMPDYEYIGCCEKGDEAVKKIAEDKPDIVIADEVIPGTDITDMVEGVSGNKNLRNVKFVLCSSKQHRNYLDFVFSTIGDKAVVRLLEQPYDEKKVRGVLDDACKGRGSNTTQLLKMDENEQKTDELEAVVTRIIHEIGAHQRLPVSQKRDSHSCGGYGYFEFYNKAALSDDRPDVRHNCIKGGESHKTCHRGGLEQRKDRDYQRTVWLHHKCGQRKAYELRICRSHCRQDKTGSEDEKCRVICSKMLS